MIEFSNEVEEEIKVTTTIFLKCANKDLLRVRVAQLMALEGYEQYDDGWSTGTYQDKSGKIIGYGINLRKTT